MKRLLPLITTILVLCLGAFAQKATPTSAIDSYVAGVKRITAVKKSPKIVVADTKDYEQEKSNWQKFASESVLEKFRKKTETYSIAYNWMNAGKLVASSFTDFSPSGDWSMYTFHYFRPDGTVAKVESEMRTFNGDYIINHSFYFDEKGSQLKKTSRYRDLTTQKPKKPTKEMLDESSGMGEVVFYKSTDKLPFAPLLGIK
jgi:hypothetical protein